jgi:hypothetical protein
MRTGKSISGSPADRRRVQAVIKNRNASQKHVWRAEIVLFNADGVGTNEIMRRSGKSKTCVWRWQERSIKEGFDCLLRDKTRPSRINPLGNGGGRARRRPRENAMPEERSRNTRAPIPRISVTIPM